MECFFYGMYYSKIEHGFTKYIICYQQGLFKLLIIAVINSCDIKEA